MTDDHNNKKLLTNKSFWVRVASAVVGAAIFLSCLVLGSYYLWGFLLAISLIGLFELNRALELHWGVFAWAGYIVTILYYVLLITLKNANFALILFGILLVVDLAVFVFTFPRYRLDQVFAGFFEVAYIGISLSFIYLLRIHPPSGAYLVWLILISAWGSDIFAYLVGMKFGKTPLVPNLSPKKSVEGAIAGIVGAALLALVYAFIILPYIPDVHHSVFIFPLISLFGAAAGQIGDLAASAIKRKVGIKDYGKLIPGHGGVLDRFDSVIMVAPIIYLVTIYLYIIG
ncbi:MAG: phosphatidate cytidylyltransferase [Lachnospiraceae bacterium]|nr:phosphatidate cytidylyltransferase [Lachnospiraceae bacterium]